MQKFKSFSNKTLIILLLLLLLSPLAEAEFYQSGLEAFTKTEHILTVPMLKPLKLIKIKTESEALFKTAESEDLQLKKGKTYYLSQSKYQLLKTQENDLENKAKNKAGNKAGNKTGNETGNETEKKSENRLKTELKSGWGVQLMASSSSENAAEFKKELGKEIAEAIFILKEDQLFKVVAASFKERKKAAELEKKLEKLGYQGWIREVERKVQLEQQTAAVVENETEPKKESKNLSNSEPEAEKEQKLKSLLKTESDSKQNFETPNFKLDPENIDPSARDALSLYDQNGNKLIEAYVFKIEGEFEAEGKKLGGEYQFGPLGNSILFSYKSNLEELTAHLLQNNFSETAPLESLKAQAVLYRTALLYQIEIQGARLESLKNLEFKELKKPVLEAVSKTEAEVLIRKDEFFYNSDYSLREISKPRSGIVSLAKANYNYQEIINYYYDRSQLVNLEELLDSEVKYTARIEPGLYLKEIRQVKWSGPRIITVLDYDLSSKRLKLKPVLAKGMVPGREDLKDLIKKHSALAGVNGGYFDYTGRPLGLIYINGDLVSEPLYQRSSLLITEDNQVSFAKVDWEGSLQFADLEKKIKINGINRKPKPDELILFNHYYGAKISPLADGQADIVIRDNRILGLETTVGVETPIPPDGFILRLAADRAELINHFSRNRGSKLKLNYSFSPDFKEKNVLHAVGGGPRILRNSKIDINGEAEHFQADILNGRAPRTALGLTADNRLLILTIDGRQSELSVGMTLSEVAETLKDLGAVNAINLDGGGSARMVIRGFTMSNPSEKRLISNGVIIDKDKN